MGRAPCCDRMGLKKGPWTEEEDRILVSYIRAHGHSNWRALPKLAGLQRCGKSCRLRWMNYLRPDIKRGNFSQEEEETIIYLHQLLGNRWSAIAARLPGRTDNEIKNVWHTHLKKRLQKPNESKETPEREMGTLFPCTSGGAASSPPRSSSEVSSSTATTAEGSTVTNDVFLEENKENALEISDSFWADAMEMDASVLSRGFPADFQENVFFPEEDDLDFWLNILTDAGNMPEILSS